MQIDNRESADAQDREDMARLAAGNKAALDALMSRHASRLFNYLLRQLHDEGDAEDAAQESFVRVFLHRRDFDPGRRFATWLYTIATNLVRDQVRHRVRHPTVPLETTNPEADEESMDQTVSPLPGPAEETDTAERASTVRRAVAQLPEELREAFVLAEYQELSHSEIGEILGCSAKAVEMRIYRARHQLREMLLNWL